PSRARRARVLAWSVHTSHSGGIVARSVQAPLGREGLEQAPAGSSTPADIGAPSPLRARPRIQADRSPPLRAAPVPSLVDRGGDEGGRSRVEGVRGCPWGPPWRKGKSPAPREWIVRAELCSGASGGRPANRRGPAGSIQALLATGWDDATNDRAGQVQRCLPPVQHR